MESACGEKRDRNRWNVYCHVPLRLFHLRKAIELLHAFIREKVHPLTAATFGDWLSPRGQVQYHKFRTITNGLDGYNCWITAMVESRLQCYGIFPKFQAEDSRVLSSPIYIYAWSVWDQSGYSANWLVNDVFGKKCGVPGTSNCRHISNSNGDTWSWIFESESAKQQLHCI